MTIKFNPTNREATCDLCKVTFLFAEGLDYYDYEDFFSLLDFLGWSKKWNKKGKFYTHVCHECKAKAKELFVQIRKDAFEQHISIADAKDFVCPTEQPRQ